MQLKIIFFFIILALVAAKEEKCGEEKAANCALKLLSVGLQKPNNEEVCTALNEATDCMNKAAEECAGGKRSSEIDKGIQELRRLISQNCPEREQEIPIDIEQCVSKLEEEFMECVSDGVAKVLENLMQLPEESEVNDDEIKCSMYQFFTKCAVQKVEDSCGKEASQLALEEMFDVPEEIQESCDNAVIKSALTSFAYNIVKRKK